MNLEAREKEKEDHGSERKARIVRPHRNRRAVNRDLACLKALFNRCINWNKYEGTNPVRKVKYFKESKGNVRFLTEEEERALLSVANDPLRTMILTGIYSRARLHSEALTLTWDNVDFKNGFLTIRDAYAKSGETRTGPLDSGLREALASTFSPRQTEALTALSEPLLTQPSEMLNFASCLAAHVWVSPWNGWSRRSDHSRTGWLEEFEDG